MQSVNGAQILNITFLFLLLGVAAVPVFEIIIGPLTSHKRDLDIEVLDLI